MTQHLRPLLSGPTYYFTLRLAQAGSTLLTDHILSLRYAYARAVRDYPVTCHAMVVLPDHLHALWTEPAGGIWYAERWRQIKSRFTQAIPAEEDASKRTPIWQRRFQEHAIRDAEAFHHALNHIRNNPVRHGLVDDPALWPYSSFNKAATPPPARQLVPT